MSIADFSSYLTKLAAARQVIPFVKSNLTSIAGRFTDLVQANGNPPAMTTPGAAVATDRTLVGCLGQFNSSGTQRLVQTEWTFANGGAILIYDRLVHMGGLDATVTTAQPAIAHGITGVRYTNGLGNMLAVEIYTQIGSTGTTITAEYTNESGTASRATPATTIGGTGFREAGRLILLPLQSGDTGVRSVQNVTLAGTTGTAGDFGFTLIHPLLLVPAINGQHVDQLSDAILGLGGTMHQVVDDACICFALLTPGTATGAMNGTIRILEE